MNKIFRNLDDYEIIYPNVLGANVSEDIVFTKEAMKILIGELYDNYSLLDDTQSEMVYFVRLLVQSSAASARKYSIKFDNKITEFDRIFELRKIKIVVDRKSLFFFMGIIIDYVKTEAGEGFVFIDNNSDDVSDIEYFEQFE